MGRYTNTVIHSLLRCVRFCIWRLLTFFAASIVRRSVSDDVTWPVVNELTRVNSELTRGNSVNSS